MARRRALLALAALLLLLLAAVAPQPDSDDEAMTAKQEGFDELDNTDDPEVDVDAPMPDEIEGRPFNMYEALQPQPDGEEHGLSQQSMQ